MEQHINKAKSTAEEFLRTGGYNCSEAVFTVVNDYLNNPVPKEVVCLASGFPLGMGMAGCTCGALAGGIMALGLKYGRKAPNVKTPGMFKAAKRLHDDFNVQFGSTCCRELIKGLELGSLEHIELCAKITGVATEMVMKQIIQG